MNDEDLGRALGTALAAPRILPVADAGSRLRARAHRPRVRQAPVAGLATVAVLLTGAVLIRSAAGGSAAPDQSAASGTAAGVLRLANPVLIGRVGPCTRDPGVRCPAVASVTFDQVQQVETVSDPGLAVVLTRRPPDRYPLTALAGNGSDTRLVVRIAGGLDLPATVQDEGDAVRIRTDDPAAVLDRLGAAPVPPARLGPGPLDVPLELRAVTRSEVGLCPAGGPGVVQSGECLVLAGSGLRLSSADLSILPPVGEDPAWKVLVRVDPADRPGLAAYTRAHAGQRIAFAVGGRPLPELNADAIRGEF